MPYPLSTDGSDDPRARRRLRVRASIRASAVRLFTERGYPATTVADIAAGADVALRTFYRYFGSKEAVALAAVEDYIAQGMAEMRARPEGEAPLDSILAILDTLASRGFEQTLALDYALVEQIPAVAGLHHHMNMAAEEELTDLFAQRLGTAPDALEPRLWATLPAYAYGVALHTAIRQGALGGSPDVWELGRRTILACAEGLARPT